MPHVRGPFIEYECPICGDTVQENAPRNPDRLVARIVEANSVASTRECAACWQPVRTETAQKHDAPASPTENKAPGEA